MKHLKFLAFSIVAIISICNINLSTKNYTNEILNLSKLQALAAEIPEVTITCDSPTYGICNALFAYYEPNEMVVFLCEFTGDPDDSCSPWDENLCNIVSGIIENCLPFF